MLCNERIVITVLLRMTKISTTAITHLVEVISFYIKRQLKHND